MNRVPKFKQFKEASLITEDSSDNMSSDFEGFKNFKVDPDAGGSNSATNNGLVEDSNESFFNENSESKDFTMAGDRKARQKSAGEGTSQMRTVDDFRLAESLNYLHRMISRKDKEDIFQLPVTDDIAPGYSLIIARPMDMSTMKKKIDQYAYNNIMEYRDDLVLMCENCMTYNKQDTIYYHAARKLLDFGLKLLSREKLMSMRRTVSFMRMLGSNELGFSLEGDPSDRVHDLNSSSNKQRAQLKHKKTTITHPRLNLNTTLLLAKTKSFSDRKDSRLLPPEGEDVEYEEDITSEVQELAQEAADRLAAKNKNGKMVYLRRNPNGSTGYTFLKENDSEPVSEEEKVVTIGNLCDGLQQASYSMSKFIEDKKSASQPMHYLENGPFSSHAPVYDVSYSNLPKEELDVLLATYGDETAYQYALSLMNFAKDTGVLFNQYVNLVLNSLSNKEHEKYIQFLAKKNPPVVKAEPTTSAETTAPTTSINSTAENASTTTTAEPSNG